MRKSNEKTNDFAFFKHKVHSDENYFLTILDDNGIRTFNLLDFEYNQITFGSSKENDIVISSEVIDNNQGYLEITEYGVLAVNTSDYFEMIGNNNKSFKHLYLSEGNFIKIIDPNSSVSQGVIFIMSINKNLDEWKQYHLQTGKNSIR